MAQVISILGADRYAYAPDFPGFGDSDPPASAPSIEDYAASIGDLLDELGHVPVDIIGYHTGSLSGIQLAVDRPEQIRRLVLIGVPVLNADERASIRAQPWPVPVVEDGSHLQTEWERSVRWAGPGQTLAQIADGFVDKLKAGANAHWGAFAAAEYETAERLRRLDHSVLVIGPRDDLWEISPRAESVLSNGTFEQWPEHGMGVLEAAPDKVAQRVRSFLN